MRRNVILKTYVFADKEKEIEDLNKPVEEAPKVTRSRSKRSRQD